MCSVLCSLGSLCGTPISGAILDGSGGWVGLALFSGITFFIIDGGLFFVTRWAQAGIKLSVRV